MILIIRGPAGAGKTTLAQRLAGPLNAATFSIDEILAGKGLDQVKGESIPLANFIEADKQLIPKARQALKDGKSVIIDGCFYHEQQLTHLLARLSGPRLTVTLTASLQECLKRNHQRQKPLTDEAVRAVYTLARKNAQGTPIDANGTPDAVAERILEELERQRKRRKAFI